MQAARFLVNGLLATGVHFGLLTFNLQVLGMESAALANVLAALGGILVSFLGNRYYVFRRMGDPIIRQAARFGILYSAIAAIHGLVLFFWTDMWGLDYRVGFLVATCLQVVLSFWGNKRLVFA